MKKAIGLNAVLAGFLASLPASRYSLPPALVKETTQPPSAKNGKPKGAGMAAKRAAMRARRVRATRKLLKQPLRMR